MVLRGLTTEMTDGEQQRLDSTETAPRRSVQRIVGPTPWPKEGDRVRYGETGREGDVLENKDGRVKVDWGLYITVHDATDLEYVE